MAQRRGEGAPAGSKPFLKTRDFILGIAGGRALRRLSTFSSHERAANGAPLEYCVMIQALIFAAVALYALVGALMA